MGTERRNLDEILEQAMEITHPTEQAAYLDQACRGDETLRSEIESLIKAHWEVGSFLDAPAFDAEATLDCSPPVGPGMVIGHYKLLEQIGEGGMATVYMAEQEHPILRKVALKIIKLGMDSKNVVARFEAERQALAMMDHPNIAKVFDAGITEAGRPYFVMELVKGVAITQYCDKNKLSTRDRLELFLQVCRAVQHAHQKGIIHRDIKPSNVLVTLHDGRPQAVVIDFGIAKATCQKLTEKTLFTRFAQMIGTPEYMSPEQAEMSRLDVDTRTDIYSLGVLLYELLTGSTPFDGDQLRQAGYAGIQRIICETEPQRPSTKLSTSGQMLTDIAQHRRTSPETLPRLVRGDLDWIVMKTLEKDRTRRYETAHALAEDVERHLQDEPILAGRPSAVHRCRKFVRRHHALVVGTVAVCVVLLAGTAVSTWLAIGKARALTEARRQADRYRAIATFLQKGVFGTLDPWRDGGRDVLIEELLQNGTKSVEGSFEDQPLVEAFIRATLGATYTRLGKCKEAEPQLLRALGLYRRLLGDRDPATLTTKLELGLLYFFAGREPEAEPFFVEVLTDSRSVLGPDHETTITAMIMLASTKMHGRSFDEAEGFASEALRLAQDALGPDHDISVRCTFVLGSLRWALGDTDGAQNLLEAALRSGRRLWGDRNPETVYIMNNLSGVYGDQGRLDNAQDMAQAALDTARESFGPAHYATLMAMIRRARVYDAQEDYDRAESLLLEVRDVCQRQEPDWRFWFSPELVLGGFYYQRQCYMEAEPCLKRALEQIYRKWGTRGDWSRCAWWLSDTEIHLNRFSEAQRVLSGLLDVLETNLIEMNAPMELLLNNMAWLMATHWKADLRNGAGAVRWATKACEMTHQDDADYVDTLAAAYAEAGNFDTAVEKQKQAIQMLGDDVSDATKAEYEKRLELYQAKKPYRQEKPEVGSETNQPQMSGEETASGEVDHDDG